MVKTSNQHVTDFVCAIITHDKLTPLTPKSDVLNSPYNITPESNIKVMKIKEMNTN